MASDLEQIADGMRAVASMSRMTSDQLREWIVRTERQVAELEHHLGGHQAQLAAHFHEALRCCALVVEALHEVARASDAWADGAAGGGSASGPGPATSRPPTTSPVINLSTRSPSDKDRLASPPPNSTFLVDGRFRYETDEHRRVVKATATLDERDPGHPRDSGAQKDVPGRLPGDHAGHIFARIFKGPGDLINLIPMHGSKVNLSAYKVLENLWSRTIAANGSAEVEVRFDYAGDSHRPDIIRVHYEIRDAEGTVIGGANIKIRNEEV